MTEGKYILWEIGGNVALVRLRYVSAFRFEEYEPLLNELNGVAGTAGVTVMVLNLETLEHFPSRMMGLLTALSKTLGRKLLVCRLRPEPLRAFKLCRLDALIPVFPGEDEAREAAKRNDRPTS